MRNFGRRHALAVGVLCVLTVAPTSARANGHFWNPWQPTAYYQAYPTSYVVNPTVYVDSSAYVTTSWSTPDFYETAYVVPTYSYARRPAYAATAYLLPTTQYLATTVLAPTAYETSETCCEPQPTCCESSGNVVAPAAGRQEERLVPPAGKPSPAGGGAAGKSVPSTVQSTPANASEDPMPEPTRLRDSLPPPAANPPAPADSSTVSPPAAPVPDKEGITPISPPNAPDAGTKPPATNPSPAGKLAPPVTPGDGLELPPKGDAAAFHEARKPVYTSKSTIAHASQVGGAVNILEGKVLREGRRESGVKITLSDARGKRSDLVAETDTYGRYLINVPDGEWMVIVPQRSGKLFTVSTLTVGNGQIIDQQGREVPSLVITR